jgi:hypothetical protein
MPEHKLQLRNFNLSHGCRQRDATTSGRTDPTSKLLMRQIKTFSFDYCWKILRMRPFTVRDFYADLLHRVASATGILSQVKKVSSGSSQANCVMSL